MIEEQEKEEIVEEREEDLYEDEMERHNIWRRRGEREKKGNKEEKEIENNMC